ncbi:aldehyde dehydrogenase family protein [Micromonospora sp. C31]|uniref:aldehyde dehydrogenase family protein n=1 Tax=Micromonospora sp. C31 TaxID=2824876 RepID=UPI001B37D4BC|nr:aldehyde dehydrogenase family protein [Micromonospora sp. C31]MBQ1073306.1 aldehyde dehydrogenase family protein [Micromonospora sp. C31]
MTDPQTIHEYATRAAEAARVFATWTGVQRRDLLHCCADTLAAAEDRIVAVAAAETGLTVARLAGELARTTGQLRLLGDFVAAGRHRENLVSPGAAPNGTDVVAVPVPMGPVAVFAASNFPLAFGVVGGDTASALAAGCPVVVKAHPAQPRTSRLLAELLAAPLDVAPPGTFALVEGGPEVSLALVTSPPIRAVGFTGSLRGGRALMDAAAGRPDPIPVYAEMGSLNPVLVLPAAADHGQWAAALAAAVTASVGQLCTKPGLVLVPANPAGTALAAALAAAVVAAPTHPMLTGDMAADHAGWLDRAADLPGVTVTSAPPPDAAGPEHARMPRPFVVEVTPDELSGELLEEHFGPAVVVCPAPVEAYPRLVAGLAGSLTATLIVDDNDPSDRDLAVALLPALAERAGRIVVNGVPTGVAVCDAMHHGGPWPATSAPWSTSVGTAAVRRFLRPVALQGVPADLAATVFPS